MNIESPAAAVVRADAAREEKLSAVASLVTNRLSALQPRFGLDDEAIQQVLKLVAEDFKPPIGHES